MPSDAQSATAEAPAPSRRRPRPDKRSKPQKPQRHAVVLHNDPHNGMDFVALAIAKVFAYDLTRCVRLMAVAHRRGRVFLWTGLKEPAEFKAQQLTALGPDPAAESPPAQPLKVTVEPVPSE